MSTVDVLCDRLYAATGCDPRMVRDYEAFVVRDDQECYSCHRVTATALIEDDAGRVDRLCVDCTEWL